MRMRLAAVAVVVVLGISRPGAAVVAPGALAAAEGRLAGRFADRGVAYPPRRVALVALKDAGRMELWADGGAGWKFVRSYLVRASSGALGPKLRQGDHQVPEGIYQVADLNPNSRFHLSLRLDYPNGFDLARAREDGRSQLGGDIMIHGDRVSDGCLPIGDAAIEEIYALAERVGTDGLDVIIAPTDLRRVDAGTAAARVARGPRWLRSLYVMLADTLRDFDLPHDDAAAVPARRLAVEQPRCRAWDAPDCLVRCGRGELSSCARAGLIYGNHLGADAEKAWSLLGRACRGGDALGCTELSRLYVADDGPRRDVGRAAALAQAACDGGDGHGCYELASLCAAGLLYPTTAERCTAEDLKRLYAKATAALRRDCDGWGAYDCSTLGAMYAPSDPGVALQLTSRSCRVGDPRGCLEMAQLYEDGGDAGRARESYARACAGGLTEACDRSH